MKIKSFLFFYRTKKQDLKERQRASSQNKTNKNKTKNPLNSHQESKNVQAASAKISSSNHGNIKRERKHLEGQINTESTFSERNQSIKNFVYKVSI